MTNTEPQKEEDKPDVPPAPEPKEEPTGHGPEKSVDTKP